MDHILPVVVALIQAGAQLVAAWWGRRRVIVAAKSIDLRQQLLTSADVAVRLGVKEWHLRQLWVTGKLPEPPRVGNRRILTEGDLPAIQAALREAGYLK
jgi:hypothetical protein